MIDVLRKVAVLQSNYIPWKGYFDIINLADQFIFYDDVQFTKNDWRNRNVIKTPRGLSWISIPCGSTISRLICDVNFKDDSWQRSHWDKVKQNYSEAPFFKLYQPFFEKVYLRSQWKNLSDFNHFMIREICGILGIETKIDDSRNYALNGKGEKRLLDLLRQVGASHYISGPSAQSYIQEDYFRNAKIEIMWMDYSGYTPYRQLHPPFVHEVSIIDLLFNEGPNAPKFLKSFRENEKKISCR